MHQLNKVLWAAGFVAASMSVSADIENYQIDNAHSFPNFNIRHPASKLSGTFSEVKGTINNTSSELQILVSPGGSLEAH